MDEREIFLLTQKNPEEEEPTAENLYSIGLVAEIKQVIKMPNDLVRVLVEGIERAELELFYGDGRISFSGSDPFYRGWLRGYPGKCQRGDDPLLRRKI